MYNNLGHHELKIQNYDVLNVLNQIHLMIDIENVMLKMINRILVIRLVKMNILISLFKSHSQMQEVDLNFLNGFLTID
jgi:hypothetical protein